MKLLHVIKAVSIGLCLTLLTSACGSSSKDAINTALESIPKTQPTQLNPNDYSQVNGNTKLTNLPAGTRVYFAKTFIVKDGSDYDGFGAGIFALGGLHIDNTKAAAAPEACLITRKTNMITSIAQNQWYTITNTKKVNTLDDGTPIEGTQIVLLSTIYSSIFLKNNTVKDLSETCFAGKLQLLSPKKDEVN